MQSPEMKCKRALLKRKFHIVGRADVGAVWWRSCGDVKGQRPRGATDGLRRPQALLLNELGNRRTRTIRLRNRLTLAKQGPVTLGGGSKAAVRDRGDVVWLCQHRRCEGGAACRPQPFDSIHPVPKIDQL